MVDAVADTKVAAKNGAMIIKTRIEMIMKMLFKRVDILGCAIVVVKSVEGILPTLMNFMLLGSEILELLTCHLTMTILICQGRLLVLQLALDPLKEAEQEFQPNAVWLFLK